MVQAARGDWDHSSAVRRFGSAWHRRMMASLVRVRERESERERETDTDTIFFLGDFDLSPPSPKVIFHYYFSDKFLF